MPFSGIDARIYLPHAEDEGVPIQRSALAGGWKDLMLAVEGMIARAEPGTRASRWWLDIAGTRPEFFCQDAEEVSWV